MSPLLPARWVSANQTARKERQRLTCELGILGPRAKVGLLWTFDSWEGSYVGEPDTTTGLGTIGNPRHQGNNSDPNLPSPILARTAAYLT
ncbi:hypothetical protein BaRGS_00036758 [Batillaria attramentaria]|uniref:Uncharacterized protein n=1 Tax=Batillaria attramentaria TaxID=370345 RepID=A0ABD0JAY1_9CAEN